MSLNSVMNAGVTGLIANQHALRTTSTNIANVNTAGYVRQETQFAPTSTNGQMMGVEAIVRRAADRYLEAAHSRATSQAGMERANAGFLDRVQAAYGDPNGEASMFGAMDTVFGAFASLSLDPRSAVRQSAVRDGIQSLMNEVNRAGREIAGLRREADVEVDVQVGRTNALLQEISALNADIQRANGLNADASGAEARQSLALTELAGLIDVRTEARELGGVTVRTGSGQLLVGHEAARLSRDPSREVDGFAALQVSFADLPARPLEGQLSGGSLLGLITARDRDLVAAGEELGSFAGGIAEALNRAHNAATAVPAPSVLNGRNTGLLGTDSLNFTGETNIAVVGTDGRVVRNVTLNFSAPPSVAVNGSASAAFAPTVQGMTDALNTALGGDGTASFVNGQFRLTANTSGQGLAIADTASNPAQRGGRGFSQFFGLNDVVNRAAPSFFETGMSRTDSLGISPGQSLTFALRNPNGDVARLVEVVPTGATFGDLEAQLNQTDVLGAYAVARFDDATGSFTLQSRPGVGRIDIADDSTLRGGTGVTLSRLFGFGAQAGATRASELNLASDVRSGARGLATAQAELRTTIGAPVGAGALAVAAGDARGANALSEARALRIGFAQAGSMAAAVTTLTDYAGRLAGEAGRRAEAGERRASTAEAFSTEAQTRRQAQEGVNLDEEIVNLTTYQQAYSASSRLIQAARDMYDTLLQLV